MPAIECPSSSFSFSSLVYLGSQEGFLGPTSTFGTSGVKETRTVYKLFETRVSTLEFTVTFLFLKKISPSLPKVKFTKTRKLPNPDLSDETKIHCSVLIIAEEFLFLKFLTLFGKQYGSHRVMAQDTG